MTAPTRTIGVGVVMAALAQGCAPAHTEVTGFVDPDFVKRPFRRLLVAPRYEDLALRTATEDAFARCLSGSGARCVPSMSILLPTRELADKELFPLLAEKRIDAVLLIRVLDAYQEREYVPERVDVDTDYFLTARQFRPSRTGSYGRAYSHTRVTRSGGYYIEYPRVRHELTLYDVATKRMAWFATALTRGEANATGGQMIDSFAQETVSRMMIDGVIDPSLDSPGGATTRPASQPASPAQYPS